MKSGTAVAPAADRIINNSDCADRILEVLQERVISVAQEETRKEVTRSLLNRFNLEISELQAKFDRRLTEVITETEALAQLRLESAVASAKESVQNETSQRVRDEYQAKLEDAEKLIRKLNEDREAAAREWQTERQILSERIATLEGALDTARAASTEKLDASKELERKLEAITQSNIQLQEDLNRAVSGLNSRSQSAPDDGSNSAVNKEANALLHSEILRVRSRLEGIEKSLADPATELGAEIRLKRNHAELEAYLKGLRYSLGEVAVNAASV